MGQVVYPDGQGGAVVVGFGEITHLSNENNFKLPAGTTITNDEGQSCTFNQPVQVIVNGDKVKLMGDMGGSRYIYEASENGVITTQYSPGEMKSWRINDLGSNLFNVLPFTGDVISVAGNGTRRENDRDIAIEREAAVLNGLGVTCSKNAEPVSAADVKFSADKLLENAQSTKQPGGG